MYLEQFEKAVRTGNASQQTAEPHGSNFVENVVDHASDCERYDENEEMEEEQQSDEDSLSFLDGGNQAYPSGETDASSSRMLAEHEFHLHHDERLRALEALRKRRRMIHPKLYRALQKALRDVRAYQYEDDSTAKVFQWIPNDREAKKYLVEGSEGGANEEEFIDVEGDAYI